MRFVFFSMRDFTRDGGGSIRMYGILNAIAIKGYEVIFISNAKQNKNFHQSIIHIPINHAFSAKQKALFQFLLSFLPASIVSLCYKSFLKKISIVLNKVVKDNEPVYFFEYLDNSIAYALKKNEIISSYINDIHGVVPVEFQMRVKSSNNAIKKIYYYFKYVSSKALDKKVFNYADGLIYVSKKMESYYEATTLKRRKPILYIIPNVLGSTKLSSSVDMELKRYLLNQFRIEKNDFIFMFAGSYKATSGVEDLIVAFKKLYNDYLNIKLMLIGKPTEVCKKMAIGFEKNIIFIDNIPYDKLYTYQNLANVIVCPDRMNPYSNMIVHLKYFDALASGKLVINGNFDSVMEINKNNCLSLTFEPSNVNSLYGSMKICIENYDFLVDEYKDVEKYTREHLTYSNYINVLIEGRNELE